MGFAGDMRTSGLYQASEVGTSALAGEPGNVEMTRRRVRETFCPEATERDACSSWVDSPAATSSGPVALGVQARIGPEVSLLLFIVGQRPPNH